jgi:glycolate oxidase FAD binding subunit
LNAPAAQSLGLEGGLPNGLVNLAIGYEENASTVSWQLERLKTELKDTELAIVDEAQTDGLWARLIEFQALAMGSLGFVANVRPSSVASFAGRLDPSLWAVQAHAGNGIVRAHALGENSVEATVALIGELRRAATTDGGNLMLARCPIDLKEKLGVWGEPRADWAIGERVRGAIDPHRAMNPGRFVGRL